jgi:hypothetical protein
MLEPVASFMLVGTKFIGSCPVYDGQRFVSVLAMESISPTDGVYLSSLGMSGLPETSALKISKAEFREYAQTLVEKGH